MRWEVAPGLVTRIGRPWHSQEGNYSGVAERSRRDLENHHLDAVCCRTTSTVTHGYGLTHCCSDYRRPQTEACVRTSAVGERAGSCIGAASPFGE